MIAGTSWLGSHCRVDGLLCGERDSAQGETVVTINKHSDEVMTGLDKVLKCFQVLVHYMYTQLYPCGSLNIA